MESNIDPIKFEVIRNTLVEATEEMAQPEFEEPMTDFVKTGGLNGGLSCFRGRSAAMPDMVAAVLPSLVTSRTIDKIVASNAIAAAM